jgi:LuxR family maltose regulon positive regulatory protein
MKTAAILRDASREFDSYRQPTTLREQERHQPDARIGAVFPETSLLSARESAVLERIGQGRSNKEIAKDLGIAPETVKSHVKNIFIKLNVRKRAQAVVRAQGFDLEKRSPVVADMIGR